MPPADDLVTSFMRIAQEAAPQKSHLELMRLERRIRDAWGGQRVYVKKNATTERKRREAKSTKVD